MEDSTDFIGPTQGDLPPRWRGQFQVCTSRVGSKPVYLIKRKGARTAVSPEYDTQSEAMRAARNADNEAYALWHGAVLSWHPDFNDAAARERRLERQKRIRG